MKKRIINVIIFIIILLMFAYFYIRILHLIHFKCPIKEIFNILCAGCGTTRMIISIFHFNFYKAFMYNELMFVTFIIMFFYTLLKIYKYIRFNEIKLPNKKVLIAYFIICIIFMILRNII